MSPLVAVRVVWGSALLIAPEAVLRELPHHKIDPGVRMFARVLGARHLLQAAVTSRGNNRGRVLAGAAVDATHAVTMVTLAALRPDWRGLALTNALTATVLAAAGVAGSGHD